MKNVYDLEQHLLGRGYAQRSVNEYCKWARRLARWCQLHGYDLATLPPHLIRAWIDATVPPGRESRKQAYTACKHLYTMLGRRDYPWEAIRVPRKRKGRPQPLTATQARMIRDGALLHGGREGLACLGLIYTAARPSEVAAWRWDGIDWDTNTITFWRTKTSDWHTVPLHPTLRAALERHRPALAEGHMFLGNNGRAHVSGTTIWTWVNKIAAAVGLEGVTPRRLRATVGTQVANSTRDIEAAAELLGHVDPAVTRRHYTVISLERMNAAMASLDW